MDVFTLPYPSFAIDAFTYNGVQYQLGNVLSVASVKDLAYLVGSQRVVFIADPEAIRNWPIRELPVLPGRIPEHVLRTVAEVGITTEGISDEQQTRIWAGLKYAGIRRDLPPKWRAHRSPLPFSQP